MMETHVKQEQNKHQKRILLHIGPHKTATTSIQSILHDYREELQTKGIVYTGKHLNEHLAARALLKIPDLRGITPDIRHWERLKQEISESEGTIIVSSELFSFATAEQIERITETFAHSDIQILISARSYFNVIPSLWQQRMKFEHKVSLSQWIEESVRSRGAARDSFFQSQDYVQLITKWSAVLGLEKIRLFIIPARDKTFVEQMEQWLSIPQGTIQPNGGMRNRSLTMSEQELTWAFERSIREAGYGNGLYLSNKRISPALLSLSSISEDPQPRYYSLPLEIAAEVEQMTEHAVRFTRASTLKTFGDIDDLYGNNRSAQDAVDFQPAQSEVPIAVVSAAAVTMMKAIQSFREANKEEHTYLPEMSTEQIVRTLMSKVWLRIVFSLKRMLGSQ